MGRRGSRRPPQIAPRPSGLEATVFGRGDYVRPVRAPVGCVDGDRLGRRRERVRRHEQDLEAPRAAVVSQQHVDGVPPQRVYQRCVRNGLVALAC